MSLLLGLAQALGGGLRGYTEGKQLDFRNRMQEEEARQRADQLRMYMEDRAQDNRDRADRTTGELASRGIRRGTAPTGKQTLGVLGSSMVPQFEIDNDQRYTQLDKDLYQDYALSPQGQARIAEQGRARGKRDADFEKDEALNETTALTTQALRDPKNVGARAGALARGVSASAFDQPTPRQPTQAEVERPEKLRSAWIDQIVAAYNGSGAKIKEAFNARPHLRALAERYNLTLEDWNAAINRWRATKGPGILRGEILEDKVREGEPDPIEERAIALRKANPQLTPADAYRQAQKDLGGQAPEN